MKGLIRFDEAEGKRGCDDIFLFLSSPEYFTAQRGA